MIADTEQSPGGLRDTVRDVWTCDLCSTRFVPEIALAQQREADAQKVTQALRRAKAAGIRALDAACCDGDWEQYDQLLRQAEALEAES